MKLVRYGANGKEKPGLIDAQGRLRDLSSIVPAIDHTVLAPRGQATLRRIDDVDSRHCVTAERALLDVVDESLRRRWPGRPPVAAYCRGSVLRGKLATPDGSAVVETSDALRDGESFEDLGRRVGQALVEQGGSAFLSAY